MYRGKVVCCQRLLKKAFLRRKAVQCLWKLQWQRTENTLIMQSGNEELKKMLQNNPTVANTLIPEEQVLKIIKSKIDYYLDNVSLIIITSFYLLSLKLNSIYISLITETIYKIILYGKHDLIFFPMQMFLLQLHLYFPNYHYYYHQKT